MTIGGSIFPRTHIFTVNMLRLTPKFFVFLDLSDIVKIEVEKE
ncbi:hypothetical protein EDO6_01833 [Paenibacillus xylanexedens]|nr:hypothetical protein EDO6_01833 [Paenibacillus xylanexedens]